MNPEDRGIAKSAAKDTVLTETKEDMRDQLFFPEGERREEMNRIWKKDIGRRSKKRSTPKAILIDNEEKEYRK